MKNKNSRQIKPSSYGGLEMIRRGLWSLKNRKKWDHLAIHRKGLTNRLPPFITLPLLSGHLKGRLRCQRDLTIVTVHNRTYNPILVQSLQYLGIEDFIVLRPQSKRTWRHTFKLKALFDYLDAGLCDKDYILFCDADDVVLRDDPNLAIQYLKQQNCDLLFSFDEYPEGYQCMPQVKEWTDQSSRALGYTNRYINAGVWVGKVEFLFRVLHAAMDYVTEEDLSTPEKRKLIRAGRLCEQLPDFPKGVGSDQIILRYLHPEFYPRMKIDYSGKLSLPRWAPSMPHGG